MTPTIDPKLVENMGFIVEKVLPPEVYCERHGMKYVALIKRAKRLTSGYGMQTTPVASRYHKHNLIVVVFPDGKIKIESMLDHLKACSKGGFRTFSVRGKKW